MPCPENLVTAPTSWRRTFRIVRHGPLLLLVTLTMLACTSNAGSGDASGEPDPSGPPSAAAPAPEGSGPEQPAPRGQAQPVLNVAPLPVGDGGDTDNSSAQQCIQVSWLADDADLSHGIAVNVTRIRIDRAKQFKLSSFDCPGESCRSFIFRSNDDSCYVAVTVDEHAIGSAKLFVDGSVRCPQRQQNLCQDFTNKAKREAGAPIQLYAPDPPEPTTTE